MMKKLAFVLSLALALSSGAASAAGTASASQTSGSAWSGEWGGADKSFDKELLSRRDSLASLFTEGTFHDVVSGQQMDYSVYVPEVCLKKERCPLVLFMADASTVGKGVKAPLMQGWGGIIWAAPETQAKGPVIVLVPSFKGPEAATRDDSTVSPEAMIAYRLLKTVMHRYNVDRDRVYTTGQSMGGMLSFYFNTVNPDLFAGSLMVSSQWGADLLKPLASDHFTYVTSAGDPKASVGMAALRTVLQKEGADIGETEFSARLPLASQNAAVKSLYSEGKPINFIRFTAGTVIPANADSRGKAYGDHIDGFDAAYKIPAIREWLLEQNRNDTYKGRFFLGGVSLLAKGQDGLNLLQRSADQNYGPAETLVGRIYMEGRGMRRNFATALDWFKKAAARGDDDAYVLMGDIYRNHDSGFYNLKLAREAYEKAWTLGNFKAPRYLAEMEADTANGAKPDYPKALDWYQKGVMAGDITSAIRIGEMYENGVYFKKDPAKALEWYLIAAPSPEIAAQNVPPRLAVIKKIGSFYENGTGTAKDLRKAYDWYRVAAEAKDPEGLADVRRVAAAYNKTVPAKAAKSKVPADPLGDLPAPERPVENSSEIPNTGSLLNLIK